MSKETKTQKSEPANEPGTAVVTWRDKMAAVQAQSAAMEAPKGGFLSFKGGRMSYNDEYIPGDKINVIIVDFLLENAWFKDDYNALKPQTPACYAFGREEEDLAPHEEATEPIGGESGGCVDCPMNEWGSSRNGGRGKDCKNSRRIAVIPSDVLTQPDPIAAIKKVQVVQCKLPVTSLKNFSSHINKIAKVMGKAPIQVVCELSVTPHPSNQFEVVWKILDEVPTSDEIMTALMAKHDQTQKLLWAPYPKLDEEPAAQKSTKY